MYGKQVVRTIYTLGDSLTDRGTMNNEKLFGIIPMNIFAKLAGRSPSGRFTNGYVWEDAFSAGLINALVIQEFKDKGYDVTDISDAIIAKDRQVRPSVQNAYRLDIDTGVTYQGRPFIQTFNEGGVTAANYWGYLTLDIKLLFTRLILKNLNDKKKQLEKSMKKTRPTALELNQSLVIEWTGANDLITVNHDFKDIQVTRAVRARIANIESLMKRGLTHFILFNLPDLSLTPRYQNGSEKQKIKACEISQRFNAELQKKVEALKIKYPHLTIDIYDVNRAFTAAYTHPTVYGFDKAKLNVPYTKSPDFKITAEHTSPAHGYMFWDDVHPTADMHAILAQQFYVWFHKRYDVYPPSERVCAKNQHSTSASKLLRAFQDVAQTKINRAGLFATSSPGPIDLQAIFHKAMVERDADTMTALTRLGWLGDDGELISGEKAVEVAYYAALSQRDSGLNHMRI